MTPSPFYEPVPDIEPIEKPPDYRPPNNEKIASSIDQAIYHLNEAQIALDLDDKDTANHCIDLARDELAR